MKSIKSALLVAVVVAASAGAASAATESFTYNFPAMPASFDLTGSVSGFDTSLGALTGVELAYHLQAAIGGTVTNTGSAPETFHIDETVYSNFAFAGVDHAGYPLSAGGDFYLVGGGSAPFGPDYPGLSLTAAASDLGDYEHPTVALGFSTLNLTILQGGDAFITNDIDPLVSGSSTVTYTYTPTPTPAVPEPATWAMMLTGFGLAGAALRRRSAAAPAAS